MKKIKRIAFIILILLAGISCKKESFNPAGFTNSNLNTNDVKETIREQMGRQRLKDRDEKKDEEVLFDSNNNENTDEGQAQVHAPDTSNSDIKEIIEIIEVENHTSKDGFDLDLTGMHPDMIFATVFMIVQDPDSVSGKTIKVKGNIYTFPSPDGQGSSQYCVMKDALQCCAQGLEIWPKEKLEQVPDDDTQILVEGTLSPYTIDGVPMTLCRIVNAKITVLD